MNTRLHGRNPFSRLHGEGASPSTLWVVESNIFTPNAEFHVFEECPVTNVGTRIDFGFSGITNYVTLTCTTRGGSGFPEPDHARIANSTLVGLSSGVELNLSGGTEYCERGTSPIRIRDRFVSRLPSLTAGGATGTGLNTGSHYEVFEVDLDPGRDEYSEIRLYINGATGPYAFTQGEQIEFR